MNKYDKIFISYAKNNAEEIYKHLETNVNPKVNWRDQDIVSIVAGWSNYPSEWSYEPYTEELIHVLNDGSEDFGVPIPNELLAYKLSLWSGTNVPTSNDLVINNKHWYEVSLDMQYDAANQKDVTQLIELLRSIASDEMIDNIPTLEDIAKHFGGQEIEGKYYIIQTEHNWIGIILSDEKLAAMNPEGKIVVLDFDGNTLAGNTDRIYNSFIQYMKFGGKEIADKNELASLVGNAAADMLLGTDGLSIFDLPSEDL